LRIAVLFISHNLDLVAEICDRVAVMYAGAIVEADSVEAIFRNPRHPYTRQLLRCIPRLAGGKGMLTTIPGTPPTFGTRISPCSFAPRCESVQDRCRRVSPPHRAERDRQLSCWLPEP
jgi:oligopeptide/dipeptide ABC transporter ATP-binding protein